MEKVKTDLEVAKFKVRENVAAGRYSYEGFTTDEHAAYSRFLMFGENDVAFPSQEEWSHVVD